EVRTVGFPIARQRQELPTSKDGHLHGFDHLWQTCPTFWWRRSDEIPYPIIELNKKQT
ncbi:hypothetical protein scyTo_0001610, partial [Scyliorhinus torazame]|nr:hypothetical protein [Scyliorhinus torazame]